MALNLSRLNSALNGSAQSEAQKKIQRNKMISSFLNTGKVALSDNPDANDILKEAAEELANADEQEFNEAYNNYMQQFEDMIFNSAPQTDLDLSAIAPGEDEFDEEGNLIDSDVDYDFGDMPEEEADETVDDDIYEPEEIYTIDDSADDEINDTGIDNILAGEPEHAEAKTEDNLSDTSTDDGIQLSDEAKQKLKENDYKNLKARMRGLYAASAMEGADPKEFIETFLDTQVRNRPFYQDMSEDDRLKLETDLVDEFNKAESAGQDEVLRTRGNTALVRDKNAKEGVRKAKFHRYSPKEEQAVYDFALELAQKGLTRDEIEAKLNDEARSLFQAAMLQKNIQSVKNNYKEKRNELKGLDPETRKAEIEKLVEAEADEISALQEQYEALPAHAGGIRILSPEEEQYNKDATYLQLAERAEKRRNRPEMSDYKLSHLPFDPKSITGQRWVINPDLVTEGKLPVIVTGTDAEGKSAEYPIYLPFGNKMREFGNTIRELAGKDVPKNIIFGTGKSGRDLSLKTRDKIINAINTGDWRDTPRARNLSVEGVPDKDNPIIEDILNYNSDYYVAPEQWKKDHADLYKMYTEAINPETGKPFDDMFDFMVYNKHALARDNEREQLAKGRQVLSDIIDTLPYEDEDRREAVRSTLEDFIDEKFGRDNPNATTSRGVNTRRNNLFKFFEDIQNPESDIYKEIADPSNPKAISNLSGLLRKKFIAPKINKEGHALYNNALTTMDDVLNQYQFFKERLDQIPALRKQSQEGLDYDELLKAYNDLDYSKEPYIDENHPNGVLLRRTPKGLFDDSNNLVIAPPDYEQSKQFAVDKLKRLGKESQDKYKSILADSNKRGYKDLPKSLSEYFRQLTNTRNMFGHPNIIGKDTLGNNIYETYTDTFGNKATVGNMRSHWLSGANPTKDVVYTYYKPGFGFAPVRKEKALEDEAKKIYKSLGIDPTSKKRISAEMVKFNREKKYSDDILKNADAALFQQYDYMNDLSDEEKAALKDKNKKTMQNNDDDKFYEDRAAADAKEAKRDANNARYDTLWRALQNEVPGIEGRVSRKQFIDLLHNTATIKDAVAEAKKLYESGQVSNDIMPGLVNEEAKLDYKKALNTGYSHFKSQYGSGISKQRYADIYKKTGGNVTQTNQLAAAELSAKGKQNTITTAVVGNGEYSDMSYLEQQKEDLQKEVEDENKDIEDSKE